MRVYLAAPFGEPESVKRQIAEAAREAIQKRRQEIEVYAPWEYKVPHAYEYPNHEWGLMVYTNDVYALDHADWVVVLSYGRTDTTVGTAWEAGYAFASGKYVLVVEVDGDLPRNDGEVAEPEIQSIMMANGCFARIRGLKALKDFDFQNPKPYRTMTEQK